jgi:AhpD family alkylhydroperoxidase
MPAHFLAHTVETAPDKVRPCRQCRRERVPRMLAKFAEAPPLLMGYQAPVPFFDKTSLNPTERLVVYLVASYGHNCDFCMSAHSWGVRKQGIDEEVVTALREGRSLAEPKFEALRVFVATMLEKRGAVSDEHKRLL